MKTKRLISLILLALFAMGPLRAQTADAEPPLPPGLVQHDPQLADLWAYMRPEDRRAILNAWSAVQAARAGDATHDAQVATLQGQIDTAEKERAALREQQKACEDLARRKQLLGQFKRLMEKLNTINGQIESRRNSMAQTRERIEQHRQANKNTQFFEDSLERQQAKLDRLNGEKAALERQKAEKLEALAALYGRNNPLFEDEEAFRAEQNRLSRDMARCETLPAQVERKQGHIDTLKTTLAILQGQGSDGDERTAEDRLAAVIAQAKEVARIGKALAEKETALAGKRTTLARKHEQFQQHIAALRSKAGFIRRAYDDLPGDVVREHGPLFSSVLGVVSVVIDLIPGEAGAVVGAGAEAPLRALQAVLELQRDPRFSQLLNECKEKTAQAKGGRFGLLCQHVEEFARLGRQLDTLQASLERCEQELAACEREIERLRQQRARYN